MPYTEKYAVWTDDGPYFGGRFDNEADAAVFIANNSQWNPAKFYIMMERWYEVEE